MAQVSASAAQMLPQLEAARKLVLQDAQIYNQILPGILPIIGPTAPVEVRRWGADFLAEGFASPALPNAQKEELSSEVLPTLRTMLEAPGEDASVVKSAVQCVAGLYPLVFRRIISHPDQALVWNEMMAIKMNILKRMDTAPPGIRICCVKFIQKIVQVQTPGVIADPRRPEQNETSIALVPRNHPLLPLASLEAEASGLLDRLLSVFQESPSDPLMIDATMNCLAVLIRTRPAISNKIVSAILSFNPFKQANGSMTPRLMVVIKSMERTTRALLRNVNKHNPNGPLTVKIEAYLMRLQQSRSALFAEQPSLKRPAPSEPTDGLDDAKRERLTKKPRKFPPMPPPPHTVAHLYTLTEDPALQQFDVKLLPIDMVNLISGALLQHVDPHSLEEAVNAIRARYVHLQKVNMPTPVPSVPMAGPTGIDDEDEYEPEYDLIEEAAPALTTEKTLEELVQPAIELGPFELPKPAPLTGAEVTLLSHQTVNRVFEIITALDAGGPPAARAKLGLNRIAASNNDRDAWVTMITRIATRAPAGLDNQGFESDSSPIKSERGVEQPDIDKPTLANSIRQTLYMYILEDFRPRLNVAISWLNEEWYADMINAKSQTRQQVKSHGGLPNYTAWTTRLLDALLPYLDARDKNLLIRFVSEIPCITPPILERVKSLARDPERVTMCVMALQYLLMFRPPVREMVLDVVASIYDDDDFQDARAASGKILQKWRPGAASASASSSGGGGGGGGGAVEVNGVKKEAGGAVVMASRPAVKREGSKNGSGKKKKKHGDDKRRGVAS